MLIFKWGVLTYVAPHKMFWNWIFSLRLGFVPVTLECATICDICNGHKMSHFRTYDLGHTFWIFLVFFGWKLRTSKHGNLWTATHTHLTAARRACVTCVFDNLIPCVFDNYFKYHELCRLDKTLSTRGIEKNPARFHHSRCLAAGGDSDSHSRITDSDTT